MYTKLRTVLDPPVPSHDTDPTSAENCSASKEAGRLPCKNHSVLFLRSIQSRKCTMKNLTSPKLGQKNRIRVKCIWNSMTRTLFYISEEYYWLQQHHVLLAKDISSIVANLIKSVEKCQKCRGLSTDFVHENSRCVKQ